MDSSNEETSERSGADKKAKKRKSRKSSSGHTTPTLQDIETPNRRLTQEELDAQSKLAASRGRAVVATSPVVASETMEPASITNLSNNSRNTNTNTNTAQVTSRDSIAKRAARRHGSGVATPGSVAFQNISPPGNEDNTRVALDIMESDLAVKSRARPSSNLYPTQQETATLNSTSLEDEEILEQKHGLDALEQDLAMKNISGARGFNSTVVDPSVRKLMTGSTSNPSIQQGDHEIKSMSIPSEGPRQEDFMFKGVAGEDDPDFKGPHEGGFLDEPGFDGPIGYGRPTPQDGFHHVSRDGDYPSTSFGPYGEVGGSGIEAFVAEQQVVDAMGVALVKSDEEQELIEKKRFRCALAIGLFVLIVLTVVIVVPVVIVLGKNEPKKTESPSASPSATPSAAPTTTRFQDILSFVRQLSANDPNVPNPLDDPTSPQFLAADWVANDDLLQAELPSDVLVQRYILAVFYFSTVGDEWEECSRFTKCNVGFSWLDGDKSECLWHGVRCNANKQVEKILIGNQVPLGNNLKGTLPAELAQLTNIVSLVLIEGLIEGTIPSEYGQWSNLNTIFIQDHLLNGTIPEELIANGGGLEMLALGGNMLSGTIPKGLASMPELRDLQLVGNQFTGPIPAELGSLSNTLSKILSICSTETLLSTFHR